MAPESLYAIRNSARAASASPEVTWRTKRGSTAIVTGETMNTSNWANVETSEYRASALKPINLPINSLSACAFTAAVSETTNIPAVKWRLSLMSRILNPGLPANVSARLTAYRNRRAANANSPANTTCQTRYTDGDGYSRSGTMTNALRTMPAAIMTRFAFPGCSTPNKPAR